MLESAMDSGSDAGAPGDHLAEGQLSDDEQRLLAELQDPAPDAGGAAVEDSPEAAAAADSDSPLPPQAIGVDADQPADPRDPQFREP